jgi:hypothetical protein
LPSLLKDPLNVAPPASLAVSYPGLLCPTSCKTHVLPSGSPKSAYEP